MRRSIYTQLREVGKLLGLDCGDNSCAFAEKRGGMRTNGGCRCDLTEAVKRALEPTASPQGEWTREAPTEAGWYHMASLKNDHRWIEEYLSGEEVGGPDYVVRWPIPISLPPPPTEGM